MSESTVLEAAETLATANDDQLQGVLAGRSSASRAMLLRKIGGVLAYLRYINECMARDEGTDERRTPGREP